VVSAWNMAVQIGIRTSSTMLNSLCNANNTYRFLYIQQICGNCLRSIVKVFLNSPTFVILALIQWWLKNANMFLIIKCTLLLHSESCNRQSRTVLKSSENHSNYMQQPGETSGFNNHLIQELPGI
jgi:hypothetical protein